MLIGRSYRICSNYEKAIYGNGGHAVCRVHPIERELGRSPHIRFLPGFISRPMDQRVGPTDDG
jgi:hypothetical protein